MKQTWKQREKVVILLWLPMSAGLYSVVDRMAAQAVAPWAGAGIVIGGCLLALVMAAALVHVAYRSAAPPHLSDRGQYVKRLAAAIPDVERRHVQRDTEPIALWLEACSLSREGPLSTEQTDEWLERAIETYQAGEALRPTRAEPIHQAAVSSARLENTPTAILIRATTR